MLQIISNYRYILFKLVFIFFFIIPQFVFSAKTLILTNSTKEYPLGLYLDILEDKENKLTIHDVSSTDTAKKFVQSKEIFPNMGFSNSAYWLRFQVKNESSKTKEWLLEISFPELDYIDFYIPRHDNSYDVKKTGDFLAFKERDVNHRNFVFRLPVKINETSTYYLRIVSPSNYMNIPIIIWSSEAFQEKNYKDILLIGIYFGIILVMFLYNLFLFVSLGDNNYLYYILYVAFCGLFFLGTYGIPFQYLWPDSPLFANHAILFFAHSTVFFALLFIKNFLITKVHIPKMNKLLIVLIGINGALIIISLLPISLGIGRILSTILVLSSSIVAIITGIFSFRKGYKPARFFLIAWTVFLSGAIAFALRNSGLLPTNFFTSYSIQLGSILEIILLSLALADRINIIKQEKENAQINLLQANTTLKQLNENLENIVAERTKDLKDSEERYRLLIELSPDDISVIDSDIDRKLLFVNTSSFKTVGANVPEELIGKSVFDFVPPDQIEKVKKALNQLATGTTNNLIITEYEIIQPDGKSIFKEVSFTTINYKGKLSFLSIGRNITERKRMEYDLLKLSLAVENSPSSIIITDKKGNIEYVNPTFTKKTGYSYEEAIGQNPRILKSDYQDKQFYKSLWNTITSGQIWRGEFYNKRKNGDLYWEYVAIAPIKNKEGIITNYVAIKEDITERKRIERLREDTERIVKHDLKTPLNGIIGFSELLLNDFTGKDREYLSLIFNLGHQMVHMIDHSLDLFKMEEGSYVSNIQGIDLIALFKKLNNELQNIQQSKSINLTYQFKGKPLSWEEKYIVSGEHLHLESLFANLIKNALEASPNNKEINISINENDDYYFVDIHNFGEIPKSIQDRLFQRYVTSGKSKGTGLGVYSALLIAKSHGGNINFTTSEDKGTHFIVSLPISPSI
ncbi:MAG: PAS domain S-box protein [Spirochaetota bacterium]|nr:PAS domain S-box protein [Spirochaetota bacterium]